ncbi:nucleotidyltransferase family protein [Brevundimonas sp. 357]|uniref:nucleotidyltransferase family protein n=1 Tax=Brevundimonas sp. 357 TaxID=2555782 RepID=UPI000F7870E3|nr:nucleotidyltransferase domain-containing protein [Brevundimonas sp. 357]RSB43125.1 DNA polymerase III subunit beta [Brevundimonas sp. 357]
MRRAIALTRLRHLEPTLRGQGVDHLYLFGSVARDEARATSDVDVAFDVRPGASFDAFDQGRICLDLADALGVSAVDFVERRTFSPRFAREVEPELLRVF